MILTWLVGCSLGLTPTVVDSGPVDVADPDQVEWTVQPDSLALGETPVGLPVSGVITLTNTGDVDLLVLDLGGASEDNLELSLTDAPMLAPGSSTQLSVVWTPDAPGALDSVLSISVGGSSDDAQNLTVPVGGTALGAVATLSTSSYDFGEVGIGCEDELTLTLTNTGNAELVVESVGLHGGEGYRMAQPDDLPWVLGPFQSQQQVVYFSPDELGMVFSELSFETDLGAVATELQGDGVVDEERSLSFDVGEQSRSTIIMNVNLTAIPNSSEDQYSTYFVAALPTFFQTLLDNHTRFRAGFVWSISGSVDGEYDYIDETFTASEATDAALAMLAPGASGGDNDANFATINAALAVNSDWLFEDDAWAESKLNLICIQRDTEASGGSWSNWVSQAQAYKDDPDDVVYHAIAGPVPGGCGSAEAFMDFDQAVKTTGGVFGSVCEPDWTNNMAQLATASMDGAQGIFQLEGTPMETSIEVSVDSVRQTEGWAYDATLNAVVFDDTAYPAFDSVVSIYYWMAGSCG